MTETPSTTVLDKLVPSTATHITFYEDRAEVTRRASISLEPGLQWIPIGGVTPFVDDRSIQAKILGEGARVVSARVRRIVTLEGEIGEEAIDALENAVEDLQRQILNEERSQQRSETSQQRYQGMMTQYLEALKRDQHTDPETLTSWKEAYTSLEEALHGKLKQRLGSGTSISDARDELKRLEQKLAQGRSRKPKPRTCVEVQVEASVALDSEMELTYRTPCALWRPEHLIRFLAQDDADPTQGGSLEIVTWATIWQNTGEQWDNVTIACSTARPAGASVAPPIEDDVLLKRRKSQEERKVIRVEVKEQTINKAGSSAQGRDVSEMPGVDDGGQPLLFEPSAPLTLASDGQPIRTELVRIALDASVTRILMPEHAPVAHIKAATVLQSKTPLLAGPARIARGSGLVGRTTLDFVAPGEPFEIGFGPDDGVRVRREVGREYDQTTVTGHQTLTRTVELYLSNLSGQAKSLRVTERVPVSEIDAVTVTLHKHGWKHEAEDGFLHLDLDLEAHETRELKLVYEIGARSNVTLPF